MELSLQRNVQWKNQTFLVFYEYTISLTSQSKISKAQPEKLSKAYMELEGNRIYSSRIIT